MSEPLFIAVDEGTTQVKGLVLDGSLNPVAEARRSTPANHPRPGWVEKDPREVLEAVVEVVAELLDQAPRPVTSMGLDHEGESVLGWRVSDGEPLTPIVVWQDKRGEEILEELEETGRARAEELSGLPADPYFSAGKLAWLLRNDGAVAAAREAGDLRLGTVDAFITDRLGGLFETDASTASRTLLAAPGDAGWNPDLLDLFGVPAELMPEVTDSIGDLGTLRHESWGQELRLTARCVDQQAALAGSGCVTPGPVKATYGTGVFVLAVTGDAPPKPGSGLLPTVAWRQDGVDTFAVDGGVFAAAAMLEWLCSEMGLAADPAALGELARSCQDSGEVMLLPALAGLGAPWWRPDARAVVAGISGSTTRAQVARAAWEGIAWRTAEIVEAIASFQEVDALRIDGGLTREPLLADLQAGAIGRPVERLSADSTAIGIGALAAVGAGEIGSVAGIAALIGTEGDVQPPPGLDRDEGLARWRAFVEACAALPT